MTKRTKAIGLLSGGLDSMLAIQLLLEQEIEVMALNFTSPFCTCSPKRKEGPRCHVANETAAQLGVEMRVMARGMDYMKMVEQPKHGRGKGVNPCIDCRIHSFVKAREVMAEEGACFVVTGEVVGQRPMSQHLRALGIIERESGLAGRVLRPLSARSLEPTWPEREGLVDRDKLLDISGRSRRPQLEMARERGFDTFACAGGGCLLTDRNVARRVRDLFLHQPDYDMTDVRLMLVGRHFRLDDGRKVIVGRDEAENRRLALAPARYEQFELVGPPCPTVLAHPDTDEAAREVIAGMIRYHSRHVNDEELVLRWVGPQGEQQFTSSAAVSPEQIEKWRI